MHTPCYVVLDVHLNIKCNYYVVAVCLPDPVWKKIATCIISQTPSRMTELFQEILTWGAKTTQWIKILNT